MAKTVIAREAHYADDIYAMNAGPLRAALLDLKRGIKSDFELTRRVPPKKGEPIPVREFYSDGTGSDWVTHTCP